MTLLDVLAQTIAIGARNHLAAELALCVDIPVLWLSRGRGNTTTVLDFSATSAMVQQAREHSLDVLRSVASLSALGPGLYGAVPELALIRSRQALLG